VQIDPPPPTTHVPKIEHVLSGVGVLVGAGAPVGVTEGVLVGTVGVAVGPPGVAVGASVAVGANVTVGEGTQVSGLLVQVVAAWPIRVVQISVWQAS